MPWRWNKTFTIKQHVTYCAEFYELCVEYHPKADPNEGTQWGNVLLNHSPGLTEISGFVMRFQFVKLSATHLRFHFIQRKWIGLVSIDENLCLTCGNSRYICGNSHENLQCAPKDFKFPFLLALCSISNVNESPQWHSALRAWIVLGFTCIPVFFLSLSVCEYIIKIPSGKLQ